MKSVDVVVIGAGAAGLACATELIRHNREVLVLEARSRVGGRAWTQWPRPGHIPVELGAEFIHGAPKETFDVMVAGEFPFIDVTDTHLFLHNGRLESHGNFFDKMGEVMRKLARRPGRDGNVAEFLARQKSLDAVTRALFESFVEGFHAADLSLIGERGLASAEETDDDDLNGTAQFRLPLGYSAVFEHMRAALPAGVLRLGHAVREIAWSPSQFTLRGQSSAGEKVPEVKARHLVVTVPLSLLKAAPPESAIRWSPEVPELAKTLYGLEMGHVQRIVYRFRSRFWENLSEKPVSFLHAAGDRYFPTWWCFQPARTPYLVAWQGGPKALEMRGWTLAQKTQLAFQTLSELAGRSVSFLNAEYEGALHHDWSEDPWTYGAYSYIAPSGIPASQRLRRPFANGKLFFAGEAAAEGYARGTVHGALQSGIRAARQILD